MAQDSAATGRRIYGGCRRPAGIRRQRQAPQRFGALGLLQADNGAGPSGGDGADGLRLLLPSRP